MAVVLSGALLAPCTQAQSPQALERVWALSLIPVDAQVFVHINFGELWTAGDAAKLRRQAPDAAKAIEGLFADWTGLPLTDLGTFSGVLLPSVQKDEILEPLWIVTTREAYDRAKPKARLGPDPLSRKYMGHDYLAARRPNLTFRKLEDFLKGKEDLESDDRWAVLFVNERAFVAGQERALRRWIDRPETGPWAAPLRQRGQHHLLFAARPDKELQALIQEGVPAALRPLLAAERLLLTADFSNKARVHIAQAYADEAGAKLGLQASEAGWPLLREQLCALAAEITGKEAKSIGTFVRLLKSAEQALAAPSCKQYGREVRVQIEMQTDALGLVTAFGEIISASSNASATFQRVGDEIAPSPDRPRPPDPKRP